MNRPKRWGVEFFAIVVMIAVVLVLAIYQYQWTGEISRTEQARLKASLASSVGNFDSEFSYDFQRLCENFEIAAAPDWSDLESRTARQSANWNRSGARTGLVAGVYVWKPVTASSSGLQAFNENEKRFQVVAWPANFDLLRRFLSAARVQLAAVVDDRDAVYYPWTLYEEKPVLIRPLFKSPSGGITPASSVEPIGFLIVALNEEYLQRQYFPDLVERHFGAGGQRSFAVSIRSSRLPPQIVYQSDPSIPVSASSPDAAVNLFDLVGDEARRRGHPSLQSGDPGNQWQLVVQHPAGSLDVAMSGWRRRNVAISFGLLSVLAGSMILLLSVARRSKALARLQMEFVAGVSHELCTPLAVINSAAENMVDGIVETPEQMEEYGGIIRGQGRRLERLVDEVLLFTAGRFGLSGYDLVALEVVPIVSQSLVTAEPALRDAGFTLEKDVSAGLPPIVADSAAVTTCIENLLSNSMKYTNSNRSIAIQARSRTPSGDSKLEVQIIVKDHGIGIPESDLPHIFEPFYRVQSARDNQIRGVGLGLHLVKRMMEDMGGRVSVHSEVGRGTEVILHFAVAESEDAAADQTGSSRG